MPKDIDDEIARLKLATMGIDIDTADRGAGVPTLEASWDEGTLRRRRSGSCGLEEDAVVLLDQRRCPSEEVELRCASAAEVAEAIRTLAIRGAPAIGVAAAYGYALAAAHGEDLDEAYDVLVSARPTAVNLRWALEEMRADPTPERARGAPREEVERCRRMAAHAAALFGPASRVLTHCNTGGLATGGYGTALGAIRAAWERGLVEHVWVDETRPLLQGARLTAWELESLGIPFAVIADAAAASLMAAGRSTASSPAPTGSRERRHREQDRHVRARRRWPTARDPVLRRRADVDARPATRRRARTSRSRNATPPRCARASRRATPPST